MPTSAHTFAACNVDDADEARPSSHFVAGVNLHLESGQVFPATGNVPVLGLTPPATGTTISLGSIADGSTGTAIVFYYNSAGAHRLVRYDPAGNNGLGLETVLLEWVGLNLGADLLIKDGVNGGVLDGLLLYRDAAGEFRCVNLSRAASGGYAAGYLAAEPFALHLVKVPPSLVLTATRQLLATGATGEALLIIQSKAYQFAYRYRYVDGEVSVLSPYSAWLDIVSDPSILTFNAIQLAFPGSFPRGVLEVEVLVREPASLTWQIADVLRRDNAGALPAGYTFYGQLFGGALPDAEATRLFESLWPAQVGPVLARSRAYGADFLEGYPTPEPAFTATVVAGNAGTEQNTLYTVTVQFSDGTSATHYYKLKEGAYPDNDSSYYLVTQALVNNQPVYTASAASAAYVSAFQETYPNESSRTITQTTATFTTDANELTTFHENSPYAVSIQFYDALGRVYGAAKPVSVFIPARPKGNIDFRSIRVELTTTGVAALNAEIPAGAYSYHWLVGVNARTRYFLQGMAADVLGYLGQRTVINPDTGQTYDEVNVVDAIHNPHEKVLVDIGNFPAAGLGYNHEPGSEAVVRFPNEGKEFKIVRQRGDYLELTWNGYPDQSTDADGRTRALIEIYVPNLTASNILYEHGPRLPIIRTLVNGQEQRSYGQRVTMLQGDCFLVQLSFPVPDRTNTDPDDADATYVPPSKKSFIPPPSTTQVECMVPPYRLVPSFTKRTTVIAGRNKDVTGTFLDTIGNAFSTAGDLVSFNLSGAVDNIKSATDFDKIRERTNGRAETSTTSQEADLATRSAAALIWLNPSYGGRIAAVIPKQLQQVRRNIERFSGQKQTGNLINGLSRWEALNQYDKLPQEQGNVTALVLADQSQTDGSVLVALQQRGVVSQYLGQQSIKTGADSILIAQADQIIGGDNTLKGGFGCTDPESIATYAGKIFYWCRERAEVVRYHNGQVPLGQTYKFRARLQALAAQYAGGRVTGCFDPRREEYWLTFQPLGDDLPGVTVYWSERREAWGDAYAVVPTVGGSIGNELLTWQGPSLHRHTPTAPVGTFFGAYTAPSVTFAAAKPLACTWQNVNVRSQAQWTPTRLATPAGQASRISPKWQRFVQGVWRAAIRRDENSPGPQPTAYKLHNGRTLQSQTLFVTLTCPAVNPGPLTGADVEFLVNPGQFPLQ